jgi:hypothetical protein
LLDRAQYDRFRVAPVDPATIRWTHVDAILKELAKKSAGRLKVEKFAESGEGRAIYLATLGTGPRRVLLWSQMHGDEPTHTAVMLDLFNYLLQKPDNPQAAEILSGCTLLYIPMLNPDGAEVVQRFNAQGIDVNRDWRRQATPEGRALLKAAKTLNAKFGFNLHNQNARSNIGRPPKPAAISVLAPAPDATRTAPPSMQRAKQMCSIFVESVRPYAEGMISRYEDTYEPRAFGDGIQSLGISTMLVEAGGWPDADPEPMTRLHFHGMLNTLHAIATDAYRKADAQIYEDLPESNSNPLNDCYIAKGRLLDAKVSEPFVADLLISQSHLGRLAVTSKRDGRIIEVGDLPQSPARLALDGSESTIVPGQITLGSGWKPGTALDDRQIEQLLRQGTTTAICAVDLSDREAIDAMTAPQSLPLNWAFVGDAQKAGALKGSELTERLAIAAANGMLAVVAGGTDETLWKTVSQLGLPLIKPNQIPQTAPATYAKASTQSWNAATALKQQTRRGRINRDYFADLLFVASPQPAKTADALDWKKLERVMVAGETVWDGSKRIGPNCGVQLRRLG